MAIPALIGDGRRDDQPALQAMVDALEPVAAKVGAAELHVPPPMRGDCYILENKLLLPRTYYNQDYKSNGFGAVHLIGAGSKAVSIRAGDRFPAGQPLIGFKPAVAGKAQAWNQKITGFTLRPQLAAGCRAIHFDFENFYGDNDVTRERWKGEIGDLSIEANNRDHEFLIEIEGNVHESWFHDIQGATSGLGTTYSTILLKFDRGTDDALDIGGLQASRIERISGGTNGGECALFDGRLVYSSIRDVIQGVAMTKKPAIAVYNGAGFLLSGIGSEGHTSGTPTILFNNCRRGSLRGATLGYQYAPYGAQATVKLVASRGCRIEDIAYWPAPVPGLHTLHADYKRVSLDATSQNNIVDIDIGDGDRLDGVGVADGVVDDLAGVGGHNYIRTWRASDGNVEEWYNGATRTPAR